MANRRGVVPPRFQARELVSHAARAAEVLGPTRDDAAHQRACHVCRHESRHEIEARYLAWHSTRELANEYGVTAEAIRSHAAVYLLDLQRVADLAPAWSQLIEAGLEAARNGAASPEHALRALETLQGLLPEPAQPAEPTWEERVRLEAIGRTQGSGGDPRTGSWPAPMPLALALGPSEKVPVGILHESDYPDDPDQ